MDLADGPGFADVEPGEFVRKRRHGQNDHLGQPENKIVRNVCRIVNAFLSCGNHDYTSWPIIFPACLSFVVGLDGVEQP